MALNDNLTFLSNAQVINGSGTSQYSNVLDLQGDNSATTTATGTCGFGAGAPVYFAAYNTTAFTTVTSVNLQLQTSDTVSGGNLSGTITTLFSSGAVLLASLTGGIFWPYVSGGIVQPTYLPIYGVKRYVQQLFTVVGPSTSEVGSVTSFLTESLDAIQYAKYPIATIA